MGKCPGPLHLPALGHPLHFLKSARASFLPGSCITFSPFLSVLGFSSLVHGLFSPVPGALSQTDKPSHFCQMVVAPQSPSPATHCRLLCLHRRSLLCSLISASSFLCLHHQASPVATTQVLSKASPQKKKIKKKLVVLWDTNPPEHQEGTLPWLFLLEASKQWRQDGKQSRTTQTSHLQGPAASLGSVLHTVLPPSSIPSFCCPKQKISAWPLTAAANGTAMRWAGKTSSPTPGILCTTDKMH